MASTSSFRMEGGTKPTRIIVRRSKEIIRKLLRCDTHATQMRAWFPRSPKARGPGGTRLLFAYIFVVLFKRPVA